MFEKIAKILKDYKGNPDLGVTESTTFDELELDSLDIVELIMSVEEEFSINIEMSEDIRSIGDLMKIIQSAGA